MVRLPNKQVCWTDQQLLAVSAVASLPSRHSTHSPLLHSPVTIQEPSALQVAEAPGPYPLRHARQGATDTQHKQLSARLAHMLWVPVSHVCC